MSFIQLKILNVLFLQVRILFLNLKVINNSIQGEIMYTIISFYNLDTNQYFLSNDRNQFDETTTHLVPSETHLPIISNGITIDTIELYKKYFHIGVNEIPNPDEKFTPKYY